MSTTVDYYTKDNDLFLKYFLIDSSFNNRGWAVDPSHTQRLAKQAIGIPFTDYEDFPVTPFNDGHPWSTKENATYHDHLEYAKSKATGVVVDFSPVSRNALKSASGQDIQQNNGYYVTVKVTNPKRKEQYLKDPARIPRVSPGVYDYNFTKLPAKNLSNIDIVHLAGVKYGAYGEKARLYASCSGGYECVNHLKGASDTEQNRSSLGDSTDTSIEDNIMVDNNTSSTDQQPQQQTQAVEATKQETQNNNNNNNTSQPNTNNNTGSPIERLKTKSFEQPTKQPNWKEDPDYLKLVKEHEELKKQSEHREQLSKYAEIIPRELFILNGKFDIQGYNKEIEKAVEKKLDPEYAQEYYSLKLSNIRLGNKIGKPFGASNNNNKEYKTPDTVPELKGASNNDDGIDSSQFQSLINIRKMFGLVNNNLEGGSV